MTLGESIRLARKKSKLTQAELAEHIGVHEVTLRNWERGEYQPKASDLTKLCEVLHRTESELLNSPAKRKLEIIIDLEGVSEMDAETIKANSVFCGYRGSDDSLIFRGAVPVDGASEQDVIEMTLGVVRVQMEAAYASRRVIAGE